MSKLTRPARRRPRTRSTRTRLPPITSPDKLALAMSIGGAETSADGRRKGRRITDPEALAAMARALTGPGRPEALGAAVAPADANDLPADLFGPLRRPVLPASPRGAMSWIKAAARPIYRLAARPGHSAA